MSDNDDDFGGFEAAPTITNTLSSANTQAKSLTPKTELPSWLLEQSGKTTLPKSESVLEDISSPSINSKSSLDPVIYKQLQDELSITKEQLLDQQTRYLQTQTRHRQEIDDTTNNFNNAVREFQSLMKQSLAQQRELLTREFNIQLEKQGRDYDLKLKQVVKELEARYDSVLDTRLENKFTEFQERMILNYESDLQDLDIKVRKIASQAVKEENLVEKARLKQNFEHIERGLKADTEKYVQVCFKNQNESFKEQIKSGIQQEHFIHKDLINNKLEKLYKASEEKRRASNILFHRHMNGLSFFMDNAHKQLGIINQAQQDLLKNKDTVDYYGDINNNNFSSESYKEPGSLFGAMKQKGLDTKSDTELPDECLIDDLT